MPSENFILFTFKHNILHVTHKTVKNAYSEMLKTDEQKIADNQKLSSILCLV